MLQVRPCVLLWWCTNFSSLAQCLYVLTEENDPAIEELRMNSGYISCLLNVVQDGTSTNSDERVVTLRTLACGSFSFATVYLSNEPYF